jgi:hypothetical protein
LLVFYRSCQISALTLRFVSCQFSLLESVVVDSRRLTGDQCEIGDNGEILVGFRYDGGEGLCMLNEIDIIES